MQHLLPVRGLKTTAASGTIHVYRIPTRNERSTSPSAEQAQCNALSPPVVFALSLAWQKRDERRGRRAESVQDINSTLESLHP